MTTYLYWIHDPKHNDIHTQGYVGITNNPDARLYHHTVHAHNPDVKQAIDNGAIMTIVSEHTTREQALSEENRYRPHRNMGLNKHKGGINPGWDSAWQRKEGFSDRVSQGMTEWYQTPEGKAKREQLRESALNRPFGPETWTAESRNKMSKSHKEWWANNKHTQGERNAKIGRAMSRPVSCVLCHKETKAGGLNRHHGQGKCSQ